MRRELPKGIKKCQKCGYLYSELDVELCKGIILGYERGEPFTSCIRCAKTPLRLKPNGRDE